jgi:hypothetical protein
VHLRLQVQLQMDSTLALSKLAEWRLSSGGSPRTVALSAEEPETATYFVLAHDRGGVAIADAVLVGEPVSALVAAKGGTGFEVGEPL